MTEKCKFIEDIERRLEKLESAKPPDPAVVARDRDGGDLTPWRSVLKYGNFHYLFISPNPSGIINRIDLTSNSSLGTGIMPHDYRKLLDLPEWMGRAIKKAYEEGGK